MSKKRNLCVFVEESLYNATKAMAKECGVTLQVYLEQLVLWSRQYHFRVSIGADVCVQHKGAKGKLHAGLTTKTKSAK